MTAPSLVTLCAICTAVGALSARATTWNADQPPRANTGIKKAGAAELPDLASATRVRVAGKYPVVWGSSLTLADADARAAQGGICQVAFEHEIRNNGAAAASTFSRRWNNQDVGDGLVAAVPHLAAGASVRRVDTLALRPGINHLLMGLDNLGQLKEANKDNNVYALTVVMNGSCNGGAGGAKVQAAGIGNSRFGPQHPAQRLRVPAVQQQPGPPTTQSQPGPPTTQLQPVPLSTQVQPRKP